MGVTIYGQDVWDKILELHSEGQTISAICRMDGMPSRRLVYAKLVEDSDFYAQFARARELAHDAIAEEALDIANTPIDGIETTISDLNGKTTTTKDMIHHRKLQVETRLKLLAKWSPSRYGDKLDVTSNGKELNQTVIVNNQSTATDINNIEG